jgi:hypothetical protein
VAGRDLWVVLLKNYRWPAHSRGVFEQAPLNRSFSSTD